MYTLRILSACALIALALPLISNAATLAELQAQLAQLMQQISVLQSRQGAAQTPFSPPATSQCPTLTRTLTRGVKGSDVKQAQAFLIAQGLLESDNNTGFFGPFTEKAVQVFQKKQRIVSSGIPATTGFGVIGPATRAAMARACTQAVIGSTLSSTSTPSVSATSSTPFLPPSPVTNPPISFENQALPTSTGPVGLFPTNLSLNTWATFAAHGYSSPVVGVIQRFDKNLTYGENLNNRALKGMPLGGIDTGVLNIETSGLLGYASIFNTVIPRQGPINLPFLGMSVGGETWILADTSAVSLKKPEYGAAFCNVMSTSQYGGTSQWLTSILNQGDCVAGTLPPEHADLPIKLAGVQTPSRIDYWGHYPVADINYETDAPVAVSLRTFSPFLPGDIQNSTLPGAVFEVHLTNTSSQPKTGTLAFTFPGADAQAIGSATYTHTPVTGIFSGKTVSTNVGGLQYDYAIGVASPAVIARTGGGLGDNASAWQGIATALPASASTEAGASVAVDFSLAANETSVVKFILTWYAPRYKTSGHPRWGNAGQQYTVPGVGTYTYDAYTHVYSKMHPSALSAAQDLAQNSQSLLNKVLAWQSVVYKETSLPDWLRSSLVNSLHSLPELSLWAQKDGAVKWPWASNHPQFQDNLFAMIESARGSPAIGTVPLEYWGNYPWLYFFPELALSTLRGYEQFMNVHPTGEAPMYFGGINSQSPLLSLTDATEGYQQPTDTTAYVSLVDRFLMCYGGDPTLRQEFYPSVKATTAHMANMPTGNQPKIISMPDIPVVFSSTGKAREYWELFPFFGINPHLAGLHFAQLQIANRLATQSGDSVFAAQTNAWLASGKTALEATGWKSPTYYQYNDPGGEGANDNYFAYVFDGEWLSKAHGLPGVFEAARVDTGLNTIWNNNVLKYEHGAEPIIARDGALPYGSWGFSQPQMLTLAYAYNGSPTRGLQLLRNARVAADIKPPFDTWNVARSDYNQDGIFWALPAALAGQTFCGPLQSGGLVNRVMQAATGRTVSIPSFAGKVIPSPFPIVSPSSIDFSAPVSGQSISAGSSMQIAWASTNPPASSAVISWLVNADTNANLGVVQNGAPADSSFSYIIPASVPPGTYKILAHLHGPTGGTPVATASSATFTVTAAVPSEPISMSFSSPSAGQSYPVNTQIPLAWSSVNAPSGTTVNVYLHTSSGTNVGILWGSQYPTGSGSYSVHPSLNGQYKFHVDLVSGVQIVSSADSPIFSITQ